MDTTEILADALSTIELNQKTTNNTKYVLSIILCCLCEQKYYIERTETDIIRGISITTIQQSITCSFHFKLFCFFFKFSEIFNFKMVTLNQ